MSTSTARDARLPDVSAPPAAPPLAALAAMPVWLVALIAVAALAALDLSLDAHRIIKALGDTDDATRLVQVRGLLAGAPWFDTTLPSIGAPQHLVSHWSRLIDLPLAVMIAALTPLLGAPAAETVTRFAWPLVLLLLLVVVLAREAERQAGRRAAVFAAVLAVTALTGLSQYMPGRIDHHNGMVLGAVTGIFLLARSFATPRAGYIAGIAFGIGTSIGYEALALTALTLALSGLYASITARGLAGLANTGIAFAATLAAALVLTVAPANWSLSHCDALSANLMALAAGGAAGLWLQARLGAAAPAWQRLAAVIGCGALGAGLYVLAQPACLKGPFGELDPAIGPVWLTTVIETKSLWWQLLSSPGIALVFVIFAGLGLVARVRQWRADRDAAATVLTAILGLAVALAAWQIKLIPYATFLAVVPLARAVAAIDPHDRNTGAVTGSAKRLIAMLLVNQFALVTLVTPVGAKLVPVKQDVVDWITTVRECIASKAVAPLAALPPGLVFANIDLGPFIVAETPSRVVAAPYHRLDKAIVETDRIFKAQPDEAAARLKAIGADYVAVCPGLTASSDPGRSQGLLGALISGNAPAFLEPVPLSGPTPVKVWRVK